MNSNIVSRIVKNPVASSLLAVSLWIVGALSSSVALMVVAGIVAYGRPLLYSALANNEAASAKAGFGSFTPLRPSAAGAR